MEGLNELRKEWKKTVERLTTALTSLGQHLLARAAAALLGVAVRAISLQILLVQPLHERHRDRRRRLRVLAEPER